MPKYVHGTNTPWFQGRYGFDLAPSAYHPYFTTFPSAESKSVFTDAATFKLNVVRHWVLISGQGITWDSAGYASGYSPTLLTSVRQMLTDANANNQAIYFTLFNHDDLALALSKGKKNFATDANARTAMLTKVISPLISAVKDDPAFFGVDIVNEANNRDFASWQQFLPSASAAIHSAAPLAQVTSTYVIYNCCTSISSWQQTELEWMQANGGFDFFDIHFYKTDAATPIMAKPTWLTKPVLVGEFGQQYFDANGMPVPGAATENSQADFAAALLPSIKSLGYAGALNWSYAGRTTSVDASDVPRRLVRSDGTFTPISNVMKSFGSTL